MLGTPTQIVELTGFMLTSSLLSPPKTQIKMENKVYQVVCDHGSYDDWGEWVIGTFTTIEQAAQVKEIYQVFYDEWKQSNPLNESEQKIVNNQPLFGHDPFYGIGEDKYLVWDKWKWSELNDGDEDYGIRMEEINTFNVKPFDLDTYSQPSFKPASHE
jgi:hypothetical protein